MQNRGARPEANREGICVEIGARHTVRVGPPTSLQLKSSFAFTGSAVAEYLATVYECMYE